MTTAVTSYVLVCDNGFLGNSITDEERAQMFPELSGVTEDELTAIKDLPFLMYDHYIGESFFLDTEVYVVSESGTMWAFEVTDTLEATALLPGGSIIVLSYL